MSKETFEEWWKKLLSDIELGVQFNARKAWDHQQKKIDVCNNDIKKLIDQNGRLRADKAKMREEYRQLESLYESLIDSKNYYIEECVNYEKKIKELEGEVEKLSGPRFFELETENKTLTAQIELLTRCECREYPENFAYQKAKCRGCKNKTLVEKDKA